MMLRGLVAIGFIGLCAGWCGNLAAQDKTPDEMMKAKGMTKAGSFYLLEDDVRLSDWLRLTRSTQKKLDDNLKKRAEIDKGIKLADDSMGKWDSEVRQLQVKQQKARGNALEYNDVGAQINTLLGRIREASRFKADREAELKKLGDPRDDYIGMVVELSDKMESAVRQYESLAKDPEVKRALTQMNEKGPPKMKLGPSVQFTEELPFIRGQRKTITSAAIKLAIEDGVPHVQATINGKLSRSLVVDSGAAVVTLTWNLAQELGLKPGARDQSIELRAADGRKIDARLMVLESIRVGQFTAENVQCAVLPQSMAGDNLLGATFLRKYVFRMDLGAGELHLSEIAVRQTAQADVKAVAASRPVVAVKGPDKNPASATRAVRNLFDFDDTDLAPATRPADVAPPSREIAVVGSSPTTRPAVMAGPATAPGVAARLRVPPAEERQKTRQLVEEIYARGMVDSSPAARRALADHLLIEAGKTPEPPIDQFVLLSGALQAAEDAKDLALCFRVIDALAGRFDVDALRLRTRSAWKAAAVADSAVQTGANCQAGLSLLDELIASDNFNDASRLIGMLTIAAAVDPQLNAVVKKQATRVQSLAVARANVAGEMEKLRVSPADPPANLAVGRFLCFHVGAWDRGIPMLALGGDMKLSALAKSELAWPTDADKQMAVADGWWDLGEKEGGALREPIRHHAAKWYESVLPAVKGLARTRIEKRLQAAGSDPLKPGEGSGRELLGLVNLDTDKVAGRCALDGGQFTISENGRVIIPYSPKGNYELRIKAMRERGNNDILVYFPAGDTVMTLVLSGGGGFASGLEMVDGRYHEKNKTTIKPGKLTNKKWYDIGIMVSETGADAEILVQLDGADYIHWRGAKSDLAPYDDVPDRVKRGKLIMLGSAHDAVDVFASVKVVENPAGLLKPGEGKGRRVDLIPLIDPGRDTINGKWRLEGGHLFSDATGSARLRIPYAPPDEYDFRIVFTRMQGSQDVSQLLSHQGTSFAWTMGAQHNTLAMLQGARAGGNYFTKVLTTGMSTESVVKVRRNSVSTYINGSLIAEFKSDYSDLNVGDWGGAEGVLGVASWESPTRFDTIEVVEVSGPGRESPQVKKTGDPRPPDTTDVTPPHPEPTTRPTTSRPAIQAAGPAMRFEPILTHKLNDFKEWTVKQGDWQMPDGRLRGEGASQIDFNSPLPGDCVLSCRINVVSGMRPRMYFDGTGMMFGNEGYKKDFFPHGTEVTDGRGYPYKNGEELALKFKFTGIRYVIEIDGEAAFAGTLKAAESFRLVLKGGDDWSRGTTEFRDFKVMAAPVAEAGSEPKADPGAVSPSTTRPARNIFDSDGTEPAPATRPAATMPATAPVVVARLPVPPAEERQKARALIEEIFATEMADNSPTARRALAEHLLSDAGKEGNPAVDRFVLLLGALHAAEDANDLTLCFNIIDRLDGRFEVDALQLQCLSAWKAAVKADSAERTAGNCRAGLALLEQLIASDDFKDASRLVVMLTVATAADPVLNGSVKNQATRLELLTTLRAGIAVELETLRVSPADPHANFVVGRFLCFSVGAWDRGLAMLRKGSDPSLKLLAMTELAKPGGREANELASHWWTLSEKEANALAKQQMRSHAAVWYKRSLADVSGLARTLAEKRIVEAGVPVMGIRVTNETNAAEASTIIAEAAVRFPDVLKDVKQVTLLRYHDAKELRRGGESKAIYGSYSNQPAICSGGGIVLSTFHEDLEAGRYLIVYRLRALGEFSGEKVCFIDVCHDAVTVAGRRPDASELKMGEWVAYPDPITLTVKTNLEYRFWPLGHSFAVDRVYIYGLR